MPDIQTGHDRGSRAPGEPFGDPFGPSTSWRRHLEVSLEFAFDDPDAFLEGIVDDVLALPAERRFSDSHEVLRDRVVEEFGSVAAFESRLGRDRSELLGRYFLKTVTAVLDETLQGVFFRRDASGHLVVAATLESIRWALQRTLDAESGDSDSGPERDRAAPAAVATFCRFWAATREDGGGVPRALLRDVVRTVNVLAGPGETAFDVDGEASHEELREMVEAFGAVVAYRDLDISVGRGAELLGCSRAEFEALLDRFGVEPRYGPDSVDELREDTLVDE